MGGGSGNAWLNDHKKILDHARGLHYDHVPGVTLPSAVDPNNFTEADKQKWISAMDAFNAWKAREKAKEASGQAWWQTYKGDSGGGGGTKPTPKPKPKPKSPIEEAAERNIYFPMLVPEYSAPQALDYSAYTSMSPFGGDGGLLYQPGTQQYREAYPIADNILSYQPPEIGFPRVTYSNPLGLGPLDLGGEGGGGGGGKKPETKNNNDLENRGGKGPGDIGYTPDNSLAQANLTLGEMIAHVVDVMQGGQGVTGGDMAGWGDPGGGASVGGSGGSSGVGPGGVGGGVGKGY